ncbi:MAG: ZIP family metal transporter [Candidatus Micrarchaeota archaeon]
MEALIWSVVATIIVSLISLVGIITLLVKKNTLNKILLLLVGFSAGALLGGAFLHLIPEAVEETGMDAVGLYVIAGLCTFFIVEKFLYWHHCHKGGACDVHTFTYMNLIGDGVHNFIDGLIISASFVVDFNLGIATTIAVIAHEIPQEIGDFGVLIYGGFGRMKALLFNFLSAITAVLGAVVGYFLSSHIASFTAFLLPFAAGGFIYIASSDLIPELHREKKLSKSIMSFAVFLIGIAFMYGTKLVFGG